MQRWLHLSVGLVSGRILALSTAASAAPLEKARGAVDPDCTLGKTVKGAARKATIGVRGNRCDLGETTRDTLEIDDRERKREGDGLLSRDDD
jgi:hypothetical protein